MGCPALMQEKAGLLVVSESHGLCEGPVVLAVCTETGELFVRCDECDTTWESPDLIESGHGRFMEDRCEGGCFGTPPESVVRARGWDGRILRRCGEEPI